MRKPNDENAVADLWMGALALESADVDMHFIEAGGTSLDAELMANDLSKTTGLRFEAHDILFLGTLRRLQQSVAERFAAGTIQDMVEGVVDLRANMDQEQQSDAAPTSTVAR